MFELNSKADVILLIIRTLLGHILDCLFCFYTLNRNIFRPFNVRIFVTSPILITFICVQITALNSYLPVCISVYRKYFYTNRCFILLISSARSYIPFYFGRIALSILPINNSIGRFINLRPFNRICLPGYIDFINHMLPIDHFREVIMCPRPVIRCQFSCFSCFSPGCAIIRTLQNSILNFSRCRGINCSCVVSIIKPLICSDSK